MRIKIKCFATLSGHNPPDGVLDLAPGSTVATVLAMVDLTPTDIKLIFVNSKNSSLDAALNDGDQVGLFPAVGGG